MKKELVLKMVVEGYDNRENKTYKKDFKGKATNEVESVQHYTQLQTLIENNNGEYKKKTLKINKLLSDKELKTIVGKTILVNDINNNLKEFKIDDFTKTYSCDSYKVIKEELETNFEVELLLSMFVNKCIKKDNKGNVSFMFQHKDNSTNAIRLMNISYKGDEILNVEDFTNKEVFFNSVNKLQINGNTYYSTKEIPQVIK